MINKEMNEIETTTKGNQNVPERKPNEHVGFYFSSGVKIFDPNTKEVILHKRGDS
jgi:hypothetical protein